MKGGIGNIMKQAQQMQENLRKAQEELAKVEVSGSAANGLVQITMTCKHEVKRVQIDASLLKDDKEMLEDLVTVALNDAVRKVEETSNQRMSGLTAGFNIPGLKLPF
jgi:nucleoid-associated protein EbfC